MTEETGLTIEETIYSKMVVRDVNNYIAVYEDNSAENEHIKLKGDYEIYKEYHKDPSMPVVAKAVKDYFVYNVPIKESILNSKEQGVLIKQFNDGRIIGVNIGYSVTLFNTFVDKPFEEYKVNYNFYISEAMKLVNVVTADQNQLSLFDF